MPIDLKDQLKRAAAEDARTVSGLVFWILKTWLKENQEKSEAA